MRQSDINVHNQNKTIEKPITQQQEKTAQNNTKPKSLSELAKSLNININDNEKEKTQQSPILKKLIDENIQCFYHFTDIKNLKNICQNGLFSREYLENNDISSKLGGNMDSRNLDARKKLLNYIRLSFCSDHPMSYRLHQNGYQLVLLKISIDIVDKIPVLFSKINATDNNVVIKKTLEHIDFSSVKRTYVKKIDPDFKTHQAEILVLNHIPAQYILNLDNPQPMYDTMLGMNNENKIQQEKSITELKRSISELNKKLNIKL